MSELSHLTLRLPEKLLTTLKNNAEKNQQTVSDTVRHLIELGLRVEELQKAPQNDNKLEAMMYKATFESMMLTRFLVRNLVTLSSAEQENMIQKAKLYSASYVKEKLGENCLPDAIPWA